MHRRRMLLLVLLFAGVAVLLLAWASDTFDAPSEETPEHALDPDLRTHPDATLVGNAQEAPIPRAPAAPPVPEGRPRDVGCSIFGVVTRGKRPVPATIAASRVHGADAAYGSESEAMLTRLSEALLDPEASPPVASAAAGADGRYEIEGLLPGRYHVVARHADGVEESENVTLLPAGLRQRVDLELPSGRLTLHGRLLHADGTPWTGYAFVFARAPMGTFLSVVLRVDAEGRFQVGGLASGPLGIATRVSGELFTIRPGCVTVPHEGEWTMVVDDGLVYRTALVLDATDETPIAGATWHARSQKAAASWVAGGHADADGRCRIPLGEGAHDATLWASAPGFVLGTASTPWAETPVLRLARAARVEGRVTDAATGKPVPGLRVCLTSGDERGGGTARTDADGRYVLDHQPAGRVLLFALGARWVSAEIDGGVRAAARAFTAHLVGGQTTKRDLAVRKAPRILGRIRDADGRPVAGARVSAEVPPRQAPTVMVELLALQAAGYGDLRWPLHTRLDIETASDPNGVFVLDALMPGLTYAVQAAAPGQVTTEKKHLVIERSGVARLDLTFPPPRWIDVTLLDAWSDTPVPYGWVMGYDEDDRWTGAHLAIDEHGCGRLGPISTKGQILGASAVGYQSREGIRVEAGQTEVTIRLQPGLALIGRVLLPDGTPLRDALVVISRLDGLGGGEYLETDEAGRFETRSLAPGRHELLGMSAWEDPEYEGRVEADAGDEEVVLRLEKRR